METHGIPVTLTLSSLLLVMAASFPLSDGATGFLAIALSLSVGWIVNRRQSGNRLFFEPLAFRGFDVCAEMLSAGFEEFAPCCVPMSVVAVKLCDHKIAACAPTARYPYKPSDMSELALLEGAQAPPRWPG